MNVPLASHKRPLARSAARPRSTKPADRLGVRLLRAQASPNPLSAASRKWASASFNSDRASRGAPPQLDEEVVEVGADRASVHGVTSPGGTAARTALMAVESLDHSARSEPKAFAPLGVKWHSRRRRPSTNVHAWPRGPCLAAVQGGVDRALRQVEGSVSWGPVSQRLRGRRRPHTRCHAAGLSADGRAGRANEGPSLGPQPPGKPLGPRHPSGRQTGRASGTGGAPYDPPQRVPESKGRYGGGAPRDTGIDHPALDTVGRPGTAYKAKVRASGDEEGEHRTEAQGHGQQRHRKEVALPVALPPEHRHAKDSTRDGRSANGMAAGSLYDGLLGPVRGAGGYATERAQAPALSSNHGDGVPEPVGSAWTVQLHWPGQAWNPHQVDDCRDRHRGCQAEEANLGAGGR